MNNRTEDEQEVSNQMKINEEHHKQQMIQLETIGLMSKYQLVFTKMDSALHKIAALIKIRNINDKYLAFSSIRKEQTVRQYFNKLEALRICKTLSNKLGNVVEIFNQKALERQYTALQKISIISRGKHQEQRVKEEQEKQKREFIHKLNLKDEEIERQKKKNEELDGILWQQRQRESDFHNKLQHKSKLIQRYESELVEFRKQPQSTKHSNNQENKLKELENNNALLNLQVQQNSMSLVNFVKEMNELLDSHSFILNEKNVSSFRAKYKC